MLLGVVGSSVADPVALGERGVQQDEVRVGLAQDFQEARRAFGEQVDDLAGVGVGGRLGRSLQRRSPSRVTTSMVTHSTSACGRSSAAGWMTNEAPEQRC